MIDEVKTAFDTGWNPQPGQMNALALAYIGDTVYDLYVRTFLLNKKNCGPHALHMAAAKLVCAAGQAAAYQRIAEQLTEEEVHAFKRGRNAHSGTVPKNADVGDYRIATGLECLFGFLYLSGRQDRIGELMQEILSDGQEERNDT